MRRNSGLVTAIALIAALATVMPAAGQTAFSGPSNGGGWSGTISGSNLVYNGASYPIINGRVTFPNCIQYIVAPNGALMGGGLVSGCTPGGGAVTPAIAWSTPASVVVGTSLSGTQLNASAAVAGTFAYNPAAGTVMNTAGTHMLSVTFTPTDTTAYTTATAAVSLTVTSSGGGSFIGPSSGGGWSGTISGSNLIYNGVSYPIVNGRVTFPDCMQYIVAPNGALMGGGLVTNCTPAGGGGSNAATPAITWATPAAVTAGTALTGAQLNATSVVAGTWAYNPPAGTIMGVAGTQVLSVTFTPSDLVNYTTASGSVILTVNKATPTISWPAPGTVPYGTALSATQLNATANAAGTFVYAPPAGSVLGALGSAVLNVTFTPTDSASYNSATASVTVQVTFSGPASGGGYSGTINGSNLIYNGVLFAIVNGRVNFPDCTTYIVAPNGALGGAAATPNCTPGSGGGGSPSQTAPTVTWATPAAITAGTALSGVQLNAAANVAGAFAYTPAVGAVMNTAGSQTLSVTFTPTDSATYSTVTMSVQIQVNAAPASFAGPKSGGGWSGTISGSSLIYNGVSYPIVNGRVTFPDCMQYIVGPNGALMGGGLIANCTPGGGSGGSPSQTAPTVTWATPGAITAGTALSGAQLNAAANVAGVFAYTPPSGTVMNTAGSQTLSVTFTPSDAATYSTVTRSVQIQVNAASTSFAGPRSGGGWSGTISGSNLIYNGVSYPIVNGRVTFPDCMQYIVGSNGALMGGGLVTNCTPGSGTAPPTVPPPPNGSSQSTGYLGQVGETRVALQTNGSAFWAFDAAYDVSTGRYLVVGYDARWIIWGQFIGRDGALIGSQFVIANAGAWRPRVVSNGAGLFAVVYTELIGSATYSLELRLVEVAPRNWSGGVSPATVISASGDIALTYQTGVAWNPVLQQYLVAWASWMSPSVGVSVSGFTITGAPGLATAPVTAGMPCGNTGEWAKRALSEFAIAPDGTGMIVGYTDTTSANCQAFGGLWYRALTPTGQPVGSVGIVQGAVDGGLHREHRVAYSPVLNRFLVVWTRSTDMRPTIYGQKLNGDGSRDGDAYVVLAPNLSNADVTDDGFGQVGLAYAPGIDRFEVAVRGNDPGNGIAPVWRIRLGSDGLPMNMAPVRVNPAAIDPWSVVAADEAGNCLIVYRLDYLSRIASTIITP